MTLFGQLSMGMAREAGKRKPFSYREVMSHEVLLPVGEFRNATRRPKASRTGLVASLGNRQFTARASPKLPFSRWLTRSRVNLWAGMPSITS